MSGNLDTFDTLWLATGMSDRTGANDETIREHPHDLSTRAMGLPHLSIGGELDERDSDGAQLIVKKLLGKGGMGMVHLAHQPLLDRDVAIKRVRPDAPAAAADSLFREARYMGSLEHPNIIPVHALGADREGLPILVMKCIDGDPWRTLIREPDHPAWARWTGWASDPVERNIEILVEVCRAIAYAHSRNILHRDLKPDNVMLGEHGEVYVLDWGISTRLDGDRRPGVVGTPTYMAPEMVDPEHELSRVTDVYLLGACLHEVLTGRPPHSGESLKEVLAAAHLSAPPDLSDAPKALAEICRKAMAADPGERFPTPEALQGEISNWLRTRGSTVLAEAAHQRLDELAVLLQGEDPDPVLVSAAFTASSFGFEQALESWPENLAAKTGLQGALTRMAAFEIARGNLDHAEALIVRIDDRGTLPDDLVAARANHAERLQLERDQDWRVSARERVIFWGALNVFGAIFTLAILSGSVGDLSHLTPLNLVMFAVVFWIGALVLIAIGRKWLYSNALNAGITNAVIAVGFMIVTHRVLQWLFMGNDISTILAVDALIMASCTSTLNGVVGKSAWAYAAGCIGVAVAVLIWPQYGIHIFGEAVAVAIFVSGIYWWWLGRAGTVS
jgi:serine/threonine-protein kinase